MPSLTDATPKQFLNADQSSLRRLQTRRERLLGEDMPQLARHAILLGQAAVLAPLTGGLSFALPIAVAIAVGYSKAMDVLIRRERVKDSAIRFDLSKDADNARFRNRFDDIQPYFVDDYLQLCRDAGFTSPPSVTMPKEERANSAAASPLNIRNDGEIIIGRNVFSGLNRNELRAVVAHELTHQRLRQPNRNIISVASGYALKTVAMIAVAAAAISSALPLLPVLGAAIAFHYLDKICESVKARTQEKICDRGAALLCGGTQDLSSALAKVSQMQKRDAPTKKPAWIVTLAKKHLPEKSAQSFLKARLKLRRFMSAHHPTDTIRNNLLAKFEAKYPVFCESRRGVFSRVFNNAAARPVAPETPSFSANRLKTQNNFRS